ncbi:MAG: dephospho-CoA kinase [Candidatus Nanopelagicales bacterium]
MTIRVGLTGGIGSGKSTVAGMFADRGAVVIDADIIAREVVRPGQPALQEITETFGPDVVSDTGELDRAALASIVFTDEKALAQLNAITHPRIAARTQELMAAADPDAVVVYDMPLLVENDLTEGWDWVVVVEAPLSQRIDRLRERGVGADNMEQRMAAQASDAQRRAVADVVIVNDGDLSDLSARVDVAWRQVARGQDAVT